MKSFLFAETMNPKLHDAAVFVYSMRICAVQRKLSEEILNVFLSQLANSDSFTLCASYYVLRLYIGKN